MPGPRLFLLTGIICGLWHYSDTSSHCSHMVNEEIERCVNPIADYTRVLNGSSSSSRSSSEFGNALQLPKLSRHVFKELCRLIRDFETCVEPFRVQCNKHITVNLIRASYGYLCNEGHEIFMRSAECLMNLDSRPSVKRCHDDTLHSIEKINSENSLPLALKMERMCGALNFFSNCVKNPIRHNCGADSWHVIYRVLEDTTKTLMPSCVFSSHRQYPPRIPNPNPTVPSHRRHPTAGDEEGWLLPTADLVRRTQGSALSMEGILAVVEEDRPYSQRVNDRSAYASGGESARRLRSTSLWPVLNFQIAISIVSFFYISISHTLTWL